MTCTNSIHVALLLLQFSFDILAKLFEHAGLHINTTKTVTIVCVLGKIRTPLLREVYDNCRQGFVIIGDWNWRMVQFEHCRLHLLAASLPTHMENQNGDFHSWVLNRVLTEEEDVLLTKHVAYLSQPVDRLVCPYPGCSRDLASKVTSDEILQYGTQLIW